MKFRFVCGVSGTSMLALMLLVLWLMSPAALKSALMTRAIDVAFYAVKGEATILVACSGCRLDHIAAVDVVKKVRSANDYAIVIVQKPFSFEGPRHRND